MSSFYIFICSFMLFKLCSTTHHSHQPHHQHHHPEKWFRSETLDGNGLYLLDWKIIDKDIVFRATVNTRGYIGLGFSLKSGKVSESDIVLAWVDDHTNEPTVLVRLNVFFFIIIYF